MAKILEHPDALSWREIFEYKEGVVTIMRVDKKPLKAYEAIAMLEYTKHLILTSMKK